MVLFLPILFNFDTKLDPSLMLICPKYHQKMHILPYCRKLMQIRCQKGAGTKMHKCLDGPLSKIRFFNKKAQGHKRL